MAPSLDDVITFIREFSRDYRTPMDENTWIDAGLGITGDDGSELLVEIEQAFGLSLSSEERGFRDTFSLGENEYLFHSEGFDPLCIGRFIDWLRGRPDAIVTDLTIGRLHQALVEAAERES